MLPPSSPRPSRNLSWGVLLALLYICHFGVPWAVSCPLEQLQRRLFAPTPFTGLGLESEGCTQNPCRSVPGQYKAKAACEHYLVVVAPLVCATCLCLIAVLQLTLRVGLRAFARKQHWERGGGRVLLTHLSLFGEATPWARAQHCL